MSNNLVWAAGGAMPAVRSLPSNSARTIGPRLPAAFPRNARNLVSRAIEAHQDAIERLIAILDAMDGDPDLEDCGDTEPGDDHASAFYWFGGSEQGRAA